MIPGRDTTNAEAFWDPTFSNERQSHGTILMRQSEDQSDHLSMLAESLDHWADSELERTWLARRGADDAWVHVSYAQARDPVRRIGAALLVIKGLAGHAALR